MPDLQPDCESFAIRINFSVSGRAEGLRLDEGSWARPSLASRARRRFRREVGSSFCIDLGRDHRSTIFVAGAGRSGTTWLADIINYRNEYHYVFEPFHAPVAETRGRVEPSLQAARHFKYRQYLRPDNRDGQFLVPAAKILSGRARSRWTERYNQRFVVRQRIVKDISSNLMLKWLAVNFPGMPILLILRHPCAVVASRRSLDWDVHWDLLLSEVLGQDDLVSDFMRPFLPLFLSASTFIEQQTLKWCMENYVPLRQFRRGEIHIVFYEELINNPRKEIPRMFRFLGKTGDASIFDKMRSPSLLSDWNSPVLKGANRMSHWRSVLNRQEVDRVMAMLQAFGLNTIYSDDSLPDPSGLNDIMPLASAHSGTAQVAAGEPAAKR